MANFDEILAYINHPNPIVRNWVVWKLAASKRPEAFEPLAKVLTSDPEASVRDITVVALTDLGDPRACAVLTRILSEKWLGAEQPGFTAWHVRASAEMALRKLKCSR